MIRQSLSRLACLLLIPGAGLLSGCVSVQTGGGRVTYWVVPGLDNGDRMDRTGTSYYNQRWGINPDSHPAVSGAPVRPAAAPDASENGSRRGSPADASEATTGAAAAPYPPYSTRSAREARADGQVTGAAVGALIGAQAGNRVAGVVVGSAVGALAGGKLADPCQPDANAGSIWGALAGGWLGSLFGGGRGRDFFIALGAASGAVRGTEMDSDGRRCR